MGHEDELVLCLDADRVKKWFGNKKFLSHNLLPLEDLCGSPFDYFPRKDAEKNYNFKHLISYILVNMGSTALTYERGKSGNEGRLHSTPGRTKISLGIGGHVTYEDFGAEWVNAKDMHTAALRELDEELVVGGHVEPKLISTFGTLQYIGMISDDSDDVGRVHLGLLYEFSLPKFQVVDAREDCLKNPTWRTGSELAHLEPPEVLESWSDIVVNQVMRPPVSTFFHGV